MFLVQRPERNLRGGCGATTFATNQPTTRAKSLFLGPDSHVRFTPLLGSRGTYKTLRKLQTQTIPASKSMMKLKESNTI